MKSTLRVSLILPAYNESAYLGECLDAISQQTVMPYEVIVVDNNSTDDTAAIARSYPFVRVVNESRQGVVYARAAGFDAARGDIIGRIDCDTIIPTDWVQTVREIFSDTDAAAISGKMLYRDIAWRPIINKLDLSFRGWLADCFERTDTVFLQGANMAMRRDAWRQVRGELCERNDIHEDYDVALHLQQIGHKVSFDDRLVADLSLRRIDTSFMQLLAYVRVNPRTYRLHNAPGQMHMYFVISLILLAYLPMRILYRGYDQETDTFTFSRLFSRTSPRVSPMTYLD